jgi:2-amino-4-hydroxy-6-hydroxymethyldihydropteridine diphosphokinase
MPLVYLGLGSNLRPEANLQLGVRELAQRFSLIDVSRVYRNRSYGFEGDDFLNAVACIETEKSAAEIADELDEIHELAGRTRGSSRFVSRTLDIDLLLYGDEVIPEYRVPRKDVLEYSFVLRPLAELAPRLRHPLTGRTMADHWAEFDPISHPLTETGLILLNDAD